jgi:hypothetical protein
VCLDKIKEGERYSLIPLERPYLNLFTHKDCYDKNKENITDYVEKYVKNVIFSAKKHKV